MSIDNLLDEAARFHGTGNIKNAISNLIEAMRILSSQPPAERKIFTVDMGSMPSGKIIEEIENMKEILRKSGIPLPVAMTGTNNDATPEVRASTPNTEKKVLLRKDGTPRAKSGPKKRTHKMADYKFDVFQAMAAVDKRNGDWFAEQPEDARKAFAAPVFLRWAASIAGDGLNHEYMLSAINERVNRHSELTMTSHPELLFRLSASCGVGKKLKHEWIPMHSRSGGINAKLYDMMFRFHPTADEFEIELLLSLHTKESFKDFIETAGLKPEEIKEVTKLYAAFKKNRDG